MNKEYIGRTVDEAIQEGLTELHLNREDVDVLVLDEGSRGVLGLFGAKMARVMLVIPDSMESFTIENWEEEEKQEAEEEQPAVVFKTLDQALAEQEEYNKDDFVPLTEEEMRDGAARVTYFLTTVAGYMGVEDPGVAIARGERGLRIRMEGDKIGVMIGHRGETLDALQLLAGLVANQNRGDSDGDDGYQRISLDIGSYRRKREQTLINLAHRLAQKAVRSRRNVSLEPMNSYERRIIHSTLASVRGVDTHSEGEDPYRHVVIQPKK